MRGTDRSDGGLFNYVSLEERIPADHPLRTMRLLVDEVLVELDDLFEGMYATMGRPSIAPERLIRASPVCANKRLPTSASSKRSRFFEKLEASHVGSSIDNPTNQRNSRL
jgi:hypothetical protein